MAPERRTEAKAKIATGPPVTAAGIHGMPMEAQVYLCE